MPLRLSLHSLPMPRRLMLTIAVALSAVVLPATASARVPHGFVGMVLADPVFPPPSQGPGVDLGGQLSLMVAAGVENLRVVFNWSSAQPYQSFKAVPPEQRSEFTDVNGVPTD